jgi:hypothetical protein
MPKFKIVAYGDADYGMMKREKEVIAISREDAMAIGWREFPEYHEIGVYEVE